MANNLLATIKKGFMSEGTIALFRDNLPNASGKHAIEAANRFAKMTYTVICNNPSLQECSLASLVKSASVSAGLDLDIDPRGLAYLVPYNNNIGTKTNPQWVKEAQFQIGYMGLIELAYRSGKVKAISAHCIYASEKDKVKITRLDGQYTVEHPFSYDTPTGDMIAVYATALVDGLGAQTCVLRKSEIENFRKMSKAPKSPAWMGHYEAMAKKTVIRQLAKFLPKSLLDDFSKGAALDERESFVDAQANAEAHISNEAGSEVVDTSFKANTAPGAKPAKPTPEPVPEPVPTQESQTAGIADDKIPDWAND